MHSSYTTDQAFFFFNNRPIEAKDSSFSSWWILLFGFGGTTLDEEAARIEGWLGPGVGLDAGNQIPVSRALG